MEKQDRQKLLSEAAVFLFLFTALIFSLLALWKLLFSIIYLFILHTRSRRNLHSDVATGVRQNKAGLAEKASEVGGLSGPRVGPSGNLTICTEKSGRV